MKSLETYIFRPEISSGAAVLSVRQALVGVNEVVWLLRCSSRPRYGLGDGGRMPRPMRSGTLIRCGRKHILEWIHRRRPSYEGTGGSSHE